MPDAASRAATFACVQQIAHAGPFWNAQWERVHRLKSVPALIAWGMKDRFFPPDLLGRWQIALPHATVRTFPNAGHFVHEEQPGVLAEAIRELVATHPVR
ncbi:MAG: alpha/beta fold hydrolase [Flavobacteriales bacterium]|nr:alpha/beta fold hydrolase [Flavobacteriales bacterium]